MRQQGGFPEEGENCRALGPFYFSHMFQALCITLNFIVGNTVYRKCKGNISIKSCHAAHLLIDSCEHAELPRIENLSKALKAACARTVNTTSDGHSRMQNLGTESAILHMSRHVVESTGQPGDCDQAWQIH